MPSYLIAIVVGALESRYVLRLTCSLMSSRRLRRLTVFCALIGRQGDRAAVQSLVREGVCG